MPLSKYKVRVRPLLGDPTREGPGIAAPGRKPRACDIGILKPSQTRKARRYRARTRYVEAPAYISGGSTVHPQVGEALGHHPDEPKVASRSAKKGIGRCMCNIITHTLTCTMSPPFEHARLHFVYITVSTAYRSVDVQEKEAASNAVQRKVHADVVGRGMDHGFHVCIHGG